MVVNPAARQVSIRGSFTLISSAAFLHGVVAGRSSGPFESAVASLSRHLRSGLREPDVAKRINEAGVDRQSFTFNDPGVRGNRIVFAQSRR